MKCNWIQSNRYGTAVSSILDPDARIYEVGLFVTDSRTNVHADSRSKLFIYFNFRGCGISDRTTERFELLF